MTSIAFAYHDVGIAGIRTLLDLGIEVAAVYTHEDDPAENRWFGSVLDLCAELGIPAFTADPNRPDELERIRAYAPAALFSFWYRRILSDPLLAVPTGGAANVHGSLLPRYRGRAPVNWQILHGETLSGATLHHMVRKADAGDIIDQEPFPIGEDDTPVDVYRKLVRAEEVVLRRSAASVVDGTARRVRQLESNATTFGGRKPEDGLIDWRLAARDVRNLVRAVTDPYPGAFTFAGGVRVLVWWADMEPPDAPVSGDAPGAVTREGDGAWVACGDGRRLRLARVEVGGRKGDGLEFPEVLADGVRLGPEEA